MSDPHATPDRMVIVGADPRLVKIAQRVNERCDWGDWAVLNWEAYDGLQRRSRVEQVRAVLEAAELVDAEEATRS